MRKRHKLGDEQIVALWEWQRGMKDSYDDMNFRPPSLATIKASTLIVYGDRDFLYPGEMAVEMYRAIPRSALWSSQTAATGPSSRMPRRNLFRPHWRSFEDRPDVVRPYSTAVYRVFPLTIFARQAYSLPHQLSFDSVVG